MLSSVGCWGFSQAHRPLAPLSWPPCCSLPRAFVLAVCSTWKAFPPRDWPPPLICVWAWMPSFQRGLLTQRGRLSVVSVLILCLKSLTFAYLFFFFFFLLDLSSLWPVNSLRVGSSSTSFTAVASVLRTVSEMLKEFERYLNE